MMRRDRFGRHGAFKCGMCGKLTRETGHDEASVKLCAFCKQVCELENALSDGVMSDTEYDVQLKALETKYHRNFEAEQSGIEADELMYGGA